ncbi:MAG TPA: carboxypeptidase-like regulatory domain-containing protein [Polyangiaceae bacterium]
MSPGRLSAPAGALISALGACLLFTAPARADTAKACVDRHYQAQVAERNGLLLRAQKLWSACARAECPPVVRDDCAALNAAVLAAIPTVTPAAVDASGTDLPEASVRIDHRPERWALVGRALPLDPGRHSLTFDAPGYRSQRIALAVREGEKLRPILIRLERLETGSMWKRAHPAAYVAAGTGAVAAGFWTYFGLNALSKRADCDGRADEHLCADEANDWLTYTDIASAITVAALGTSAYFFFLHPGQSREQSLRGTPALRLTPRVQASQASLSLGASF